MTRRPKSEQIAVVTVHGTNDTAAEVNGEKWWQLGSSFSDAMGAAMASRGVNATHHPFRWSGANSDLARGQGARLLARKIKALSATHESVHIVAHSHGGNVANLAADLLRWGNARNAGLASIVTVGTPFLRRRISGWAVAGAIVFLAVSVLIALSWARGVASNLLAGVPGDNTVPFWVGLIATATPIVIAIALTVRGAVVGLSRVLLPNAHLRSRNAILALRHPQDEAIAFLQQIDAVQLEPIPKGALLRGSGGLAAAVSSFGATAAALALTGVYLVHGELSINGKPWLPINDLWLISLLFCVLYLVSRLAFGVFPEAALRGVLNRRISESLRGVALGTDGVQRLGEVAVHSHTLRTVDIELDADLLQRMRDNAAAQAGQLIEKYRWPLFTAGADAQRSVAQIAEDALTWSSLIHTTYFDQPEMPALIADRIAAAIAERSLAAKVAAQQRRILPKATLPS
jgi:hypothetical protein